MCVPSCSTHTCVFVSCGWLNRRNTHIPFAVHVCESETGNVKCKRSTMVREKKSEKVELKKKACASDVVCCTLRTYFHIQYTPSTNHIIHMHTRFDIVNHVSMCCALEKMPYEAIYPLCAVPVPILNTPQPSKEMRFISPKTLKGTLATAGAILRVMTKDMRNLSSHTTQCVFFRSPIFDVI